MRGACSGEVEVVVATDPGAAPEGVWTLAGDAAGIGGGGGIEGDPEKGGAEADAPPWDVTLADAL